MNTKKESQQYSKLKQNNPDFSKNSNIAKLQNIWQTWRTGLVQSYQEKSQRDMTEHDSRILDDQSKQIFDDQSEQIFIQFELSRAKHI